MNKLEKLYKIIQYSKDTNVELGEDTLRRIEELEEAIIKDEILPTISNDIAPRLNPIKRDLVLVVEYHPGNPLSVALSRKAKISEIDDAKELTLSYEEPSKKLRTRGKYTGLIVTLPDGTVINEPLAKDTMVKAIKLVGVDKAMKVFTKTFFTTKKYSERGYDQVKLNDEVYLLVNNNNNRKARYLKALSDKYNLSWKVEVVK